VSDRWVAAAQQPGRQVWARQYKPRMMLRTERVGRVGEGARRVGGLSCMPDCVGMCNVGHTANPWAPSLGMHEGMGGRCMHVCTITYLICLTQRQQRRTVREKRRVCGAASASAHDLRLDIRTAQHCKGDHHPLHRKSHLATSYRGWHSRDAHSRLLIVANCWLASTE
jgi:hypothetical protein